MSCVQTIFSDNNGAGLIVSIGQEEQYIEPNPISLHNDVLRPGEKVDLDGHLSMKFRYVGTLKTDHDLMCFHLTDDLFYSYYLTYSKIDQNTIYTNFSWKGGRDYIWNGQKWK